MEPIRLAFYAGMLGAFLMGKQGYSASINANDVHITGNEIECHIYPSESAWNLDLTSNGRIIGGMVASSASPCMREALKFLKEDYDRFISNEPR